MQRAVDGTVDGDRQTLQLLKMGEYAGRERTERVSTKRQRGEAGDASESTRGSLVYSVACEP